MLSAWTSIPCRPHAISGRKRLWRAGHGYGCGVREPLKILGAHHQLRRVLRRAEVLPGEHVQVGWVRSALHHHHRRRQQLRRRGCSGGKRGLGSSGRSRVLVATRERVEPATSRRERPRRRCGGARTHKLALSARTRNAARACSHSAKSLTKRFAPLRPASSELIPSSTTSVESSAERAQGSPAGGRAASSRPKARITCGGGQTDAGSCGVRSWLRVDPWHMSDLEESFENPDRGGEGAHCDGGEIVHGAWDRPAALKDDKWRLRKAQKSGETVIDPDRAEGRLDGSWAQSAASAAGCGMSASGRTKGRARRTQTPYRRERRLRAGLPRKNCSSPPASSTAGEDMPSSRTGAAKPCSARQKRRSARPSWARRKKGGCSCEAGGGRDSEWSNGRESPARSCLEPSIQIENLCKRAVQSSLIKRM